MSVGWSGPDPVDFSDGPTSHYELGTQFTANADVTISHVRVWGNSTGATRTGREARIWTTGGTQQRLVALDDVLPAGWTLYALGSPLEVTEGGAFVVSYEITDKYGAVTAPASGYPRASSDTLLTATTGKIGDGTPGQFPGATATAFYGIDVQYSAGIAGNQRPVVGISATVDALQAVATLTIEDEVPATVTYRVEWGDGQASTVSGLGPHAHTYDDGGMYAIMVTATDEGALTDSAAIAVLVPDAFTAPEGGVDVDGLLQRLIDHALAGGYVDAANTVEPKTKPGNGITLALWLDRMGPASSGSGATSLRLLFNARLYTSMLMEPPDRIDPMMVVAAAHLMGAWTGDFTLGDHPQLRQIDLLGIHGIALEGQAGYIPQGNPAKLYRVFTITVPLILNDTWTQEA